MHDAENSDHNENSLEKTILSGIPAPKQQWLNTQLLLRSELKFDTRSENGRAFVVIEDPVRSKFFQVGVEEFDFIVALDGTKTTQQIVQQLAKHDRCHISLDQAITICQWLIQSNLVLSDSLDSTRRLGGQADALERQKLMGWFNPISFKVSLFNPNALLTACQKPFAWLFSKWFLMVWLVACAYAAGVITTQWAQLGAASRGILSDNGWIGLLVFWLLLKVIHEFAHGVACKKYGGEVPEAGVLFLLFTPMAFVNVTSMWRFANHWHRIVVAVAGMYVELFISFIAVIVWSRTDGLIANTAYNVFLMASVTTILFNANPLMRFDGYFILSDLVRVPSLYPKGTRWFGDRARHWVFGTDKTLALFSANEATIVKIYGTLAWFWKWSISVGLIITASVMFNGAGLILASVGAVLWIGMPIFNQFRALFGPQAKVPYSKTRTGVSCVAIASVVVCVFFVLKAPATKSAPGMVQFADESIVRAETDGFVDEIFVTDGQVVKPNQALVKMRNDDLDTQIEALLNQYQLAKIQARIFRQQGELALSKVEQETMAGVKKQLDEKQAQRDGLTVRSPIAGKVFRRNLDDLRGSFLKRGHTLVNVAQQDTKELVVSVDQADLESIKSNIGNPVRVLLPGRPVFSSTIQRITPSVSTTPTEMRICVNGGGVLPVKPNPAAQNNPNAPEFVLLSPRFDAYVPIDHQTGNGIAPGQRCEVFFASKEQSLGNYMLLGISKWLQDKIQLAVETSTL